MKRETINYFAAGVFVIVSVTLLLVVLYRITGTGGVSDTYYTDYPNVAGLSEGTLVTYEGYAFGRVASIRPQRAGKGISYRVELQVQPGWRIPADSVARIYSEGLLADTVVDIDEGTSAQFLEPGGTLRGAPAVDLFALLGQVAGDFNQLNEGSIRPLLETVRGSVTRVSGAIEDKLPGILSRLDTMSVKLDDSATHMAAILDRQAVARSRRILGNADQAAENFLDLSQSLAGIKKDITHLIDELDALVSDSRPDVRRSLLALRHTLENVSRYSGDILMNLDSGSRNMNEFSRLIRENPGRLLGGAAPRDAGVAHE